MTGVSADPIESEKDHRHDHHVANFKNEFFWNSQSSSIHLERSIHQEVDEFTLRIIANGKMRLSAAFLALSLCVLDPSDSFVPRSLPQFGVRTASNVGLTQSSALHAVTNATVAGTVTSAPQETTVAAVPKVGKFMDVKLGPTSPRCVF